MANRYFELTENIPYEDARELHDQFKHHLDHVLRVSFMPESKGKHLMLVDSDGRSQNELFGGPEEKFIHLYNIEEYSKF